MNGEELIGKLTLEAVNIFYLAGHPEDPAVSKLESVIELAGEAWGLPEVVKKSKETIAAEREATRAEANGETPHPVVPKEKILQCDDDGESILALLWALFETAARLDIREKRGLILESAHYMADYLGLKDWLSDSAPVCEARPA